MRYQPCDPEQLVDWNAALEESRADIAAGRIVAVEPVLERLRASAARMDGRSTASVVILDHAQS